MRKGIAAGRLSLALLCFAVVVVAAFWASRQLVTSVAADSGARVIPPPALDEPTPQTSPEIATVAGGCFWGVQGVFQHVKGVLNAVSGYAGGDKSTAEYERVSTGTTGHAESVQVTFDPRQISFGHLLQIYFAVVHDPTELNRQGPDAGPQYRSTIFAANDVQARVAQAYIAQLNEAQVFRGAIVTTIESGRRFYPAEAYHQDFLTRHPTYPYIAINDLPKVEALKRVFPASYRPTPSSWRNNIKNPLTNAVAG